ncbi:MAG TPA: glycosyltransferase family 4 protein [Gemmatimonadaceae bacterium]
MELDTERGWRGGERQVLLHAQVLTRLGHRVLVAARPTEPLADKARAANISVIPLSPASEFDPFAAMSLRRVVLSEGVDIVHAHSAHGVALGALACIATRAKLVVTRHATFRLRANLASRWKYQRPDALIAVSGASQRAMIASGIPPDRITIVHGGSDQSHAIAPADRRVLEALGVPGQTPLVVQVAQLTPEKDPLTFVEAIHVARRSVPSLHALLVGGGDSPLPTAVEHAVAERELGGTLHLTGYRTDADSILAAADVVALSSKQDALPTVLFDALFCRKPICATDAGGIPEIIESGVSGLLTPVGDGAALGQSIARVLADSALSARLAAAAGARAPEFSIERSVEHTIAVFERVLGARLVGALSNMG